MVITALKQQIKNPERISVFVDGKYGFSLTLSQIVDEKLKVGLSLNDDVLALLKKKSTDEKLRLKAMNWVLLRPRSIRELEDYLRRVTYLKNDHKSSDKLEYQHDSKYAKTEIIAEFTRRGWVNDEIFARWWVERSSRSNRSTSHLKGELMQKGVSREIISNVLDGRGEEEPLKDLVIKLREKAKYQDQQKLLRYLVGKGFSYSSVAEALRLDAEDRLG